MDRRIRRIETKRRRHVVLDLLQTLITKFCERIFLVEADQRRYLLVADCSDLSKESDRKMLLQNMTSKINLMIQEYTNRKMALGFSGFANSYTELNRLYIQATESLEMAVFLEQKMVIFGEMDIWQKYSNILEGFSERIQKAECLDIPYKHKLEKDIRFLIKQRHIRMDEMKERFIHWIHGLTFTEDILVGEMSYPILGLAIQMRAAESLLEMIRIFDSYLDMVPRGVDVITVSNEVAEVIGYVREYCCNPDISLTKAALKVDMNKDYLSKIFKKEVGVGFSEYVNIQRIKCAKELLETTHMKSYEVSAKVGFQDESYFSKIFKNVVGVRPNDYKKKVISKREYEK